MSFENLKSTGIKYLLGKLKTVFLQIKDAVKTVNNVEADEDGNITINSVPFAQNLESESSQRNYDSFILRTSGGESSINDGDAWLMNIHGNAVHDGFVPESIVMTVTAIERENPITAEIDHDTFVAYVEESGTITFVYSSSWNLDPELYGITIDGTPVSGDIITVVYVKEERGTITVANPQSFFATGWNLYSSTLGYARVVKYSHGYKISGSGTALQYSATLSGERTTIVVTDGNFDIPSDGYVWVTNGDSTTAIWMTWTDWTETANNGEYEGYTESVIDLSSVMSTYFPDGLLKVGNTFDEIDLNLGQAYIRVERMSYTDENLETAKNSGREYDYDEDYIYLAKATATVHSITINGMFTTSDHGMDGFIGTDVEVYTQILYGNNLKNKLERDVLTISQQTLTSDQQGQVRQNIGAAGMSDIPTLPTVTTLTTTVSKCTKSGVGNNNVAFRYGNIIVLPIDITASSAISSWSDFFITINVDLTDVTFTPQICSVAMMNFNNNTIIGYLYAQKSDNKIKITCGSNMSSGTRYRALAIIVIA